MDPIKSAECGTSEHGWTTVESRRKQKQLAKQNNELDNERRKERHNKHLKAKEIKKPEAAKNNFPDSESEKPKPDEFRWPDNLENNIDSSESLEFQKWNPDTIVLNLVNYFGYYLADVSSEQFKYPWRNMNNLA
ncbi:unnamed protein product [Arabis nemorensis]|uniref:Uncharacterized protein n=1 Tax=Arabis nemorensis TaxID=586526 RepID=A0A565BJ08_9BRAS|nr:unnamed protein product [Arabis nemorensis]